MILEGGVAWEPLLAEWECQKADNYRELAADLATQHPWWRVVVVPIVIGCLGTLRNLRQNLGLHCLTSRHSMHRCPSTLRLFIQVPCPLMSLTLEQRVSNWISLASLSTSLRISRHNVRPQVCDIVWKPIEGLS